MDMKKISQAGPLAETGPLILELSAHKLDERQEATRRLLNDNPSATYWFNWDEILKGLLDEES